MGKTIEQATKQWVGEFNAIPQSLIVRAFKHEPDNLTELTKISTGDTIYSHEHDETLEVLSVNQVKETVTVMLEDEEIEIEINELSVARDSSLPMWGTMWSFGESIDEDWTRDNLEKMSECGFRIYEDEETGDIYFGIDGAGYDFYEQHWIPLYKLRGLQWHDTE